MSSRDAGRWAEAVARVSETLMGQQGVTAVLLLSHEGAVLLEVGASVPRVASGDAAWAALARALWGTREAELVFEHRRLYARRVEPGHLLVLLDASAGTAMVRLQCDALAPTIRRGADARGLSRFFRRAHR